MDWLRDSIWQSIAALAALLGLAAAIILPIVIYRKQQNRKAIAYEIISNDPVLSVKKEEVEDKLQILFGGKPVEDVRLLVLRIYNSGNASISSADYEQPIEIGFGEQTKILSAEVTDTTPSGIPASIEPRFLFSIKLDSQSGLEERNLSSRLRQEFEKRKLSLSTNDLIVTEVKDCQWQIDDSTNDRSYTAIKEDETLNIYEPSSKKVILRPLLLNSKDSIRLKVLLAQFDGKIVMGGRIAGVKQIQQIPGASKTESSPMRWVIAANAVGVFVILVFLPILLYSLQNRDIIGIVLAAMGLVLAVGIVFWIPLLLRERR